MGSAESDPLGLVGSLAAVSMILWIASMLARRRAWSTVPGALAFAVLFWILVAVPGGLSGILWSVGFHSMRAWARVSILVLLLVLLWAALTMKPALDRLILRPNGQILAVAAVVAVVAAALLNQAPKKMAVDTGMIHRYYADRNMFARFERDLPVGASVLQLPVRRFPESIPRHESGDYALLIPFIQTSKMRFSYGGMKGRDAEWQVALDQLSGVSLVQAASAAGYDAILIDRRGYEDDGHGLARSLRVALDLPPMRSLKGRWVAFDLTEWRRQHRPPTGLRTTLFSTPQLNPGTCYGWDDAPEWLGREFWCPKRGTLLAVAPRSTARSLLVLRLTSPRGTGTVQLHWLGKSRVVKIGPKTTVVRLATGKRKRVGIAFIVHVPHTETPGDAREMYVGVGIGE